MTASQARGQTLWFVAVILACVSGTFILCLYAFGTRDVRHSEASKLTRPSVTEVDKNAKPVLVESSGAIADAPPPDPASMTGSSAKPVAQGKTANSGYPFPQLIVIRADGPRKKAVADATSLEAANAVPLVVPKSERVRSTEVHMDSKGCDACSNSINRDIAIPQECTYDSHTLTQLKREPYVPIEEAKNPYTWYYDVVYRDAKNRIEAVGLRVHVAKTRSTIVNPAITMRLSVVAMCPEDTSFTQ